ncbi:hypothetical protein EON65_49585, partial [archaeon]
VNGYRVELGEIEKTLMMHERVLSAVVAVHKNTLCAYIVLRVSSEEYYVLDENGNMIVEGSEGTPSLTDGDISSSSSPTSILPGSPDSQESLFTDLRSLCRIHLTDYMVPHHWCVIDEVPLSANGKVMRDKLRSISFEVSRSRAEGIAVLNDKEEILMSIWKSILGCDVVDLNLSTNFFSAGGDSLKSIQVVSHCKSRGLLVTVPQIFSHPTIRELAEKAVYIAECGPIVLGTSTEQVSSKPIFEIIPSADKPNEEYPMIGINQAHFVGLHTSSYSTRGLAPQIYFEWEFGDTSNDQGHTDILSSGQLDIFKLENAVNRFVQRHMTFRSIVTSNGTMKLLTNCPKFEVRHMHLWTGDSEASNEHAAKQREHMLTIGPTVYSWPMFDIRVTQTSPNSSIIHVVVSLFLMDAMSDLILRQELSALYREEVTGNRGTLPAPAGIQFKDYCYAMAKQLPQSLEYRRAREYWFNRIPKLSLGPELPLLPNPIFVDDHGRRKFVNRHRWLTAVEYKRAKRNCSHHSVTMPSVLLSAYALVLFQFNAKDEFLLNILLCLRHQVHEDVNKLVGNCSSTVLCNVNLSQGGDKLSFLDAVRTVSKELSENLEHSYMSGIEVMQELNRIRGNTFQAVAPFIFTTPIGVEQGNQQVMSREWMFQERFFSERVPHTACVNAIKADPNGTACASMDVVDGQFPAEVIDGMFRLYSQLLDLMCSKNPQDWNKPFNTVITLPNPADTYIPDQLFPDMFMHDSVAVHNDNYSKSGIAVMSVRNGQKQTISYSILSSCTTILAAKLVPAIQMQSRTSAGIKESTSKVPVVAIVMEKGWEQVVAAVAILRIHCAYLPMDAKTWPE